MRRLIKFLALLPAALCSAYAANEPVFPGMDRTWSFHRSANFELYSAHNDRLSRDVLEQMELLRAAFLETIGEKVRVPLPVTIYYFDRKKDFDSYLPPQLKGGSTEFAGVCSTGPDRTVIMLAPIHDRDAARELVFHEYVHYLFRVAELHPAPWFEEGFAELFSTMQVKKDGLVLGDPVAGNVYQLQRGKMFPLEQLFAVRRNSSVFRESGHTGIFYAQSWLFLHYLTFSINNIPDEKETLFLRVASAQTLQENPEKFRAVCRNLLGMEYPELLEELQRYMRGGKFIGRKVPRPTVAPKESYEFRKVAKEEIVEHLAGLMLRQTESDYALWFIRDLLSKEPNARLHELLGMVALKKDQPDVAREHWNKAVELGTSNPAIFSELARLEFNSVFNTFDLDYQLPAESAQSLRRLLKRSLESAPDQSQGYEMLAWIEAAAHKPNIANVNLVQRRMDTLNQKDRTVLAIAVLRMRRGEKEDALKLLDDLEKLNPSDWVRYNAEVTRARIEGRPVDQTRLPRALSDQPGGSIRIPEMIELPR